MARTADLIAWILAWWEQLLVLTAEFSLERRFPGRTLMGRGLQLALLLIFNTKTLGKFQRAGGWPVGVNLIFKRNKRADPGNYRPGEADRRPCTNYGLGN